MSIKSKNINRQFWITDSNKSYIKADISENYYAQVERGEKNPSTSVLVSIMRAIGGVEGFELSNSEEDGIMANMNEAATRKDIDEVIGIMKDFMSQVSGQFGEVNDRLDKMDQRLDQLDQKYDHLLSTIDNFVGRIDRYESELAARDNQFERLLDWARKVSEKTGIPLENL